MYTLYSRFHNRKVDYDLGDIVLYQNAEWGVQLETRITEITEVYEESGFNLILGFGNDLPTVFEKIKKRID